MITKEFAVGPTPDIDIHISSGRVEIKPGKSGVVRVEVDTKDPGFVIEQIGDQIRIASDRNASWIGHGSDYVSVTTPEMTDVNVICASASVECTAQIRRATVKTASGDIEVSSAETVVIKTASGDARLGTSTHTRISSASGDVRLEDCPGTLVFSSASGDLRLMSGSGSITASTASGNVEIGEFTGQSVNVKTLSGDVTVGLPAGTSLDLDATLLSGRLHLPDTAQAGPRVRQTAVKAKLVSGDLHIRRTDG